MNLEQRLLVKKYLDILLRKHKIVLMSLLIGTIAGFGMYLKTPKIYRCQSLIQYQRQGINPTELSPDDRSIPRIIVNTVKEQVLSRTSLENIITENRLYENMLQRLPMEDVVEYMRRQITISAAGRGGEIHRISYVGSNPRRVMLVTNSLASKFIEENLRFRQEKVSETSNYIEDELKMAQAALDKEEAVMRDYKLKHYNEMPEQRSTNMERLNALQQRFQESIESSHETERTIVLIQEQISLRQQLITSLNTQSLLQQENISQPDNGLETVRGIRIKLLQLKSRYTDNHPEVKRLQRKLEEFGGLPEPADKENPSVSTSTKELDPQFVQLNIQLQDLKNDLKRAKEDRNKMQKEVDKLHSWIEAGPIREAEWSALTRDYEQLQNHYQELVRRNLQAESAQSLEKRQQGSQFKIIDPARIPLKPYKPDFKKILLMTIGLGLGAGGALAVGVELLSTSFKAPHELESHIDLPIVSVIPLIRTKQEIKKRLIIQTTWWLSFGVMLLGLFVAAVYLWRKGYIIL